MKFGTDLDSHSPEGYIAPPAYSQHIDITNPAVLSAGIALDLVALDKKHYCIVAQGNQPSMRLYTIDHDGYEAKLKYSHQGDSSSKSERVGKCYLSTVFSDKTRISGSWNSHHTRSSKLLDEPWISESGILDGAPVRWVNSHTNEKEFQYRIALTGAGTHSAVLAECQVHNQEVASIRISPQTIHSQTQLEEILTTILAIYMRTNLDINARRAPASSSSSASATASNNAAVGAVIATLPPAPVSTCC